jgi:dihydrofolate reductase
MRKIIASEFMSLDGVIETANRLTAGPDPGDQLGQAMAAHMAGSDALLLGRVTYQEMGPFWASQAGADDPVVVHMSKPKFVVSATLDNTNAWPNSTLIRENVAEQLTRLKEQPGKNILVIGSATLVRWLLREGLLDELDLLVFPVVEGRGKRLFTGDGDQVPLTLTGFQAFRSGVVHLTYHPAST